MPVVAQIDGIRIEFYFDDHPPLHFHARQAEHIAAIDIRSLEVLHGSLPPGPLRATLGWAETRQDALLRAWYRCRAKQYPGDVP